MCEAAPALLPVPASHGHTGSGGRLLAGCGSGTLRGALITAAERRVDVGGELN